MNPTRIQVWVALEPIQCLGNSWERDWIDAHGGDYAASTAYPSSSPWTPGLAPGELEIIRNYYARQGVTVFAAEKVPAQLDVTADCSLEAGYTLYLLVRREDVPRMVGFGYREESPG